MWSWKTYLKGCKNLFQRLMLSSPLNGDKTLKVKRCLGKDLLMLF
ncbi:hypothetical protein Gohar_006064 [Gossypium harknessii]|uniref:Uncharacterized protein n=1 Tax=Gossypium harknessii TaxID=34285 RepID=A0A7J9GE82_9ROSI|nr:hypothetical protein [Gossypium harknessii]